MILQESCLWLGVIVLNNVYKVKNLFYLYDKGLGWWKGTVTSIFIPFHFRNFFSNTFNMWLSGMKIKDFQSRWQTAYNTQRYVHAVYKGDKGKIAKYGKHKIGDLSMKDFVDWIRKTQVADEGWWGAEMGGLSAYIKLEQKLTQKGIISRVKHPLTTGREFGLVIENNSKIALFADSIIQGEHPVEAAMKTKKYLFDYFDLTPAEKTVLKRIVPFYTWSRKNMPLQLEQLVKQPGKYAGLAKIREEVEGMSPDLNKKMKYLPEWMQKKYLIGLPTKKKDKLPFLLPDLAFQDLARMTSLTQWVSQISPILKAPLEYAANYDFFRRRRLVNPDLKADETQWLRAKQVILNNLRVQGYLIKMSKADRSLLERIMEDIIGMNVYQYDIKRGKSFWLNTEKKYRRAIAKEKKKRKRMGRIKYFLNTSRDYQTFWECEFDKIKKNN